MQEKAGLKRSLTRTLAFTGVVIFLMALIGVVYWSKLSKSQLWFDEGWYQTFMLKNGMQVIVIPNHKIPAVSHMVWYRVGAVEDPDEKSGLAHFLEHLMFKGTPKHPAGEFSKLVEQNGGHENAFTSHDYTAYYQVISKDKLPLMMELEADRMTHLSLKQEDVDHELQVILEERKMRIDNQPRALMKEQMDLQLYQDHPYGTQVIGWSDEMEGLTRNDALAFYKKYYAPNNAILVVAGDVDAKDVEALAKKYYGVIPANPNLKDREIPALPEQLSPRDVVYPDARVREPEYWRSYMAPNFANNEENEDFYALTLLSKIVGEGNISRLYRSLVVDKKIATSVGSDYSGLNLGPGEFEVYAIPSTGVPVAEVKKAIDAELEKVLKEGVTDDELELAKKSLLAEQIYEHEGLQNLSTLVGALAVLNVEPEFVSTLPDRINAVTTDEIQEAAQKVIKPENSVSGELKNDPNAKPEESRQTAPEFMGESLR